MNARARIPPDLLKRVKEANNLLQIVGEHVVLRKSGANYVGLCPFHSERSPSFSVSEQKQLYHCYGCKKGGDIVTFLIDLHGLSFSEAVEELSERGKVSLGEWQGAGAADPEAEARRKRASLAFKLNKFAAAYFRQALGSPEGTPLLRYLRNRRIEAPLENEFYLGGALPGWDGLTRRLISGKAPMDLATELGLIRPSSAEHSRAAGGPGFFDLFRNRVLFPVLDLRGRIVAFGGRLIESGEPKYLNSPESFIFQKSRQLFGLFQAQKHIRDLDQAVVVEGYFDALALVAAGIPNVVATCGTALTEAHFRLLRRFTEKVIVLFDGDRAGVQATERAMETGLDQGLVVYGAALPGGMDPDEFAQAEGGVERLRGLLAAARPVLDTRMEQVIEESVRQAAQIGTAEAQTQALKQAGAWLARFQDPVGRELRIETLSQRLGVSRDLVMRAMGGTSTLNAPSQRPNPPQSPRLARQAPTQQRAARKPVTASEKILLQSLVNLERGEFAAVWEAARARMPVGVALSDLFEHPSAKSFTDSRPGSDDRNRPLSEVFRMSGGEAAALNWSETDAQVRSIIAEAGVGKDLEFGKAELEHVLEHALGRVWARFSQQLRAALTEAEARNDSDSHARLLQEYLDVQRKMKEFKYFYD